jgi:hypothetical protein
LYNNLIWKDKIKKLDYWNVKLKGKKKQNKQKKNTINNILWMWPQKFSYMVYWFVNNIYFIWVQCILSFIYIHIMFVQSTSHKQQNVTNELCELREESLMSSRSVSKPVCHGYEGTRLPYKTDDSGAQCVQETSVPWIRGHEDWHIRPMTVLRSVSRKPVYCVAQ